MKKEKYIKDVLRNIETSNKVKKRIREDLLERIDHAMEEDPFFDVIESIGDPKEVAKEFTENLDEADGTLIQIGLAYNTKSFEYKSKASMLGLPFIHINTGGRYSNRVAKGIIAIGDVSMGLISIGGVSLGVVSIGGIGLGIIGLGGVGIGILGLGGVGIGMQAFGGIAIGIQEAFGAITQVLNKII